VATARDRGVRLAGCTRNLFLEYAPRVIGSESPNAVRNGSRRPMSELAARAATP
jgi:hypothetical protein